MGDRAYCFLLVIPPLLLILPLLHNTIYCYIEPALAPNVKEMQQNAIHLRRPRCRLANQTNTGLDNMLYKFARPLALGVLRSSIIVCCLLKALWGGHTAALQLMLGIQLQVSERKHAIRDRRFARGRKHEDMHAIYLAGSVSNTYVCDVCFKIESNSDLKH